MISIWRWNTWSTLAWDVCYSSINRDSYSVVGKVSSCWAAFADWPLPLRWVELILPIALLPCVIGRPAGRPPSWPWMAWLADGYLCLCVCASIRSTYSLERTLTYLQLFQGQIIHLTTTWNISKLGPVLGLDPP